MPVHAPGPRLLAAPTRGRPRRRSVGRANLLLLPFIDVMLVLLLFLLPQFDLSLATCMCGPSWEAWEVPYAEHTNPSWGGRAPLVEIRDGRVHIWGYGRAGDLATLKEDLEPLTRNFALIHPGEPRPTSFVLLADRRTEYRLIRQVFAAFAEAGFPNGQLIVSAPYTLL